MTATDLRKIPIFGVCGRTCGEHQSRNVCTAISSHQTFSTSLSTPDGEERQGDDIQLASKTWHTSPVGKRLARRRVETPPTLSTPRTAVESFGQLWMRDSDMGFRSRHDFAHDNVSRLFVSCPVVSTGSPSTTWPYAISTNTHVSDCTNAQVRCTDEFITWKVVKKPQECWGSICQIRSCPDASSHPQSDILKSCRVEQNDKVISWWRFRSVRWAQEDRTRRHRTSSIHRVRTSFFEWNTLGKESPEVILLSATTNSQCIAEEQLRA